PEPKIDQRTKGFGFGANHRSGWHVQIAGGRKIDIHPPGKAPGLPEISAPRDQFPVPQFAEMLRHYDADLGAAIKNFQDTGDNGRRAQQAAGEMIAPTISESEMGAFLGVQKEDDVVAII